MSNPTQNVPTKDFVGRELLGYIERNETDKVAQAATDITRTQLREDSFMGNFLPYEKIDENRLHPGTDEKLRVIEHLEPDSPGGKYAPLGTLPDQEYIEGGRYEVPFARLYTRELQKDTAELLTYPYRIVDVLMDNQIKDALAELDGKFVELCESIWSNTTGGVPGANLDTGKVQWLGLSGGLTTDNLVEAKKMLPRGNANGRFRLENHCVLMNAQTAQDYTKITDQYTGDSIRDDMFRNGLTMDTIYGLKHVFTIKDDLIPDNKALFFPAPEFLGKAYYLHDWTTFIKREGPSLHTYAYWLGGFAIGNIAGACYVDFDA